MGGVFLLLDWIGFRGWVVVMVVGEVDEMSCWLSIEWCMCGGGRGDLECWMSPALILARDQS